MAPTSRALYVLLTSLLNRRFPSLDDPASHIVSGRVLVDGAMISNPRARVRANASIKLRPEVELRGTRKLGHTIRELSLELTGAVAVDLGAAAGGFTRALLDAGVRRVYAVDVGFGQLRGSLRNHPRVVTLERTNLASLDTSLVPDTVDILTADLSYLSLAGAARQFGQLRLASDAQLLALVKPTFELHAGRLAASDEQLAAAVAAVQLALATEGWRVKATLGSPIPGRSGAREEFIYATRDK